MTRAECEAILAKYIERPNLTQQAAGLAEALAETLEREARIVVALREAPPWECHPDCQPGINKHTGWCRDVLDAFWSSDPTPEWLTRETLRSTR